MVVSLICIEEKDIQNGRFACPEGIRSIEADACGGLRKTALTSLVLPEGLTAIKAGAFADCKNLVELHLPSTVKHIGAAAFQGCTSLRSIHLSQQLCFVGNEAFRGCTALEEVIFPKKQKLSYLMHTMWAHCPDHKYLYFWGDNVFLHCNALPEDTKRKLLACENSLLTGADEWKTYLSNWIDYRDASSGIIELKWLFSVLQEDLQVDCIARLLEQTKVQVIETRLTNKYCRPLFASMEDNGLCFRILF